MSTINSFGKPPLYPRQRKEQALSRPSRKRKAETIEVMVDDNHVRVLPLKRTRYEVIDDRREEEEEEDNNDDNEDDNDDNNDDDNDDEDENEIELYGLLIIDQHDANSKEIKSQKKVTKIYLGSIWLPDEHHRQVRRSHRISKLGSSWISHPEYGLLRRSSRLSASSLQK